jgi:hypothetical protein
MMWVAVIVLLGVVAGFKTECRHSIVLISLVYGIHLLLQRKSESQSTPPETQSQLNRDSSDESGGSQTNLSP